MRFKVDSCLLYCSEGVCKVEGIEEKDFFGEKKAYYRLSPIYHAGGKLFVPVDGPTTARLHLLMERQEAESMLNADFQDVWIEDDNERKLQFRALTEKGNSSERCALYSALIKKEVALSKSKKHLRSADEKLKKELERLLSEELAYLFEITPQEGLLMLRAAREE